MPMLLSEETMLMTARILWRNVTIQLKSFSRVWLKNKGDIDLWSLSLLGANPSSGSEQRKVVVNASALQDTYCQVIK